jgi:hypothetical protein
MPSDITKQSERRRLREGVVARRLFRVRVMADEAHLRELDGTLRALAQRVGEYQEPTRH